MHGDKRNRELNILVEMFKDGDQSAFEEIYKRCRGHIAFVCSKFCDNKQDVEEIVQDTFMDAFKKAKELRGDTLVALLRKIAVRKCYDKHKKNKSEPTDLLDQGLEVTTQDKDFLPEAHLQNKEIQSEILRIVNELPPKQREIIYLYYYADINTEEIARLNNCPSSNVRQALHKARNTIKNKIGDQCMAGVSIAFVLLAEESAFVAGYSIAGAASTVVVAGKAAAANTIAAKVAAVAVGLVACAVIVGAVWVYGNGSDPPIPVVEDIVVEIEPEAPVTEELPAVYDNHPQYEILPPLDYFEDMGQDINDDIEEIFELIVEQEPEPEEIETIEAPDIEVEEPYEPEPPPEPEPEPVSVDRTPQILAALQNAAQIGSAEVYRVIEYYGFALVTEMRTSVNELFWFYVLDDGSGDILVGLAEYEDGSNWRMQFEHFVDGQRPQDRFEMFSWMEG